MRTGIRLLILFLLFLVAAAAALGVLYGIGWWHDRPVEIGRVDIQPPSAVQIGVPVTCRIEAAMPWSRRPIREPDIVLPDGLQLARTGPMRFVRSGAGAWTWEAELTIQAVGFEVAGNPVVRLFFTANRHGESKPLEVELPFPSVVARELGEEDVGLTVAGAVEAGGREKPATWWRWAGLGAVLVAALAVLVAILRSRGLEHGAPPKPPWEIAELAIQKLGDELPMAPPVFFQKLTDIVRYYIERRFDMPATERTTPEFMGMVRSADWLDREQAAMLDDFLTSADQVKFARADATLEQMNQALAAAGGFVDRTRPQAAAAGSSGEGGAG